MKLAILGTGNVGAALGKSWAAKGHEVTYGTRDPGSAKVKALLDASGSAGRAATVGEAAAAAGTVVLAPPWPATKDVIESAGDLSSKILIDCTNPLHPDLSGLTVGHTTSAGEQVAEWAAGARVVKAFNTLGAQHFPDPRFGDQAATMFLCGDDTEAKAVVAGLTSELGFDVVDVGPLAEARLLEPLAMLWIRLAYVHGLGNNIAFKLLRK